MSTKEQNLKLLLMHKLTCIVFETLKYFYCLFLSYKSLSKKMNKRDNQRKVK